MSKSLPTLPQVPYIPIIGHGPRMSTRNREQCATRQTGTRLVVLCPITRHNKYITNKHRFHT
ncbi:hypothetical protein SSSM7_085 [Synechococcus phage S-SSM7]|uniref:Uncharacterized protein n=1 Tax=Synechococcus phage S-SSM7 TaxID=445686 RepID=E3SL03_9CAUD|nr:hypothetical protein SSSM7_085 [Synechococcus phage S-SSM7]ADO98151.1 hypothetical protein SSSM7_085 [Synechococcus phage S-SSM7]